MRELPILFSTPMVQAIQEHRKVMTRRTAGLQLINFDPNLWRFDGLWANNNPAFEKLTDTGNKTETYKFVKPRYQVGDKLWVKETFTVLEPEHCYDGMKSRFVYKADCDLESEQTRKEYVLKGWPYQWKPSLFMPKAAARLWLEVTEVRCERLQLISHSDALNEGIKFISDSDFTKHYDYVEKEFTLRYPSHSFFSLWRSINGKDSVAANPWVFVYRFKRIPKP